MTDAIAEALMDGYKALARQVIIQAVLEYKQKPRNRGPLMRYFFNTDNLDFYAYLCGLDPDSLRDKLKIISEKAE
jgi:hypothetical protein